MGSWNHSCALTGLPVHADEEVYVFLLIEESEYRRADVNAHNHWSLSPFSLEAKYNDYGGFTDFKEDAASDYFLEKLRNLIIEREEGESGIRHPAVSRKGLTWERVFEYINGNRLLVKAYVANHIDKQVRHICVKKSIFDEMVAHMKLGEPYNDEDKSYDELVTLIKSSVNDMAVYSQLSQTLENIGYRLNTANSIFGEDIKRYTNSGFPYNTYDQIRKMEGMTEERAFKVAFGEEISRAEAVDLIINILRSEFLIKFYTNTRRMFVPMSGAGSQETDLEPYQLAVYLIEKGIEEDRKRWDELE